ncbi:tetratricopeptide repeat protein, partial [Candidatus Poribacteria bacterium]|nr:tetratricopeptide repeat protein [Candidatus Poribacteria bacterium]
LYRVADLYQQDGQYERAIAAFDILFEKNPETTWRDKAVYQQAVCYQSIREFSQAYEGFKAYMSTSRDAEYYREADRMVRQMELDEDGDGYMFYQEQEAGTSDQDKNDHPGAKKVASLPPETGQAKSQ